jgi:hypothetical protein
MKHTNIIRVAAALAAALFTAACGSNNCGTATVVLLDGSCSRVNLAAYHDAWARISARVGPGDRLVLGRITSDVREFRPDLDIVRPAPWILLDNPLDRDDRAKAFNAQVMTAFTKALEVPCSGRTAILDTLDIAARLLTADPRPHHTLVILSDMLEDSDVARFESGLTPRQASKLVETRRNDRNLPNLTATEVQVVGAAAPSGALTREVQRFWMSYLEASGATLKPEHYGPVLFGYE